MSGAALPLDARWRVLHDNLWVGNREWNTSFAFGGRSSNRVNLQVSWKEIFRLAPCLPQKLAMEDEGFVFFDETSHRDGDEVLCQVAGGKPGSSGVVHVRIQGRRGLQGDYTLTQLHHESDLEARDAANALVSRLAAEYGKGDISAGALKSYHWRNDLSGAVTRVPGDWEFSQRMVNANGSISFAFARRTRQGASEERTEEAWIVALPLGFFDGQSEDHEAVEKTLARSAERPRISRRSVSPREYISDIESETGVLHAWTRRDRFLTWAAFWQSPPGGPVIAEPSKHPLLSELLKTIR